MTGTTHPRNTRGRIVRTAAVYIVAAAAVAAGAPATGAVASSEQPSPPTWNASEHEAHRPVAEAQERQESLNSREHEGHRPAAATGRSGRAPIADTCAAALGQAWEDLGHFSDGMETWMLSTPACSTA